MLVDPLVLLAFLPAALALNLTPGADMMFCLAQGMRGGAAPAIAASAGISVGGLITVTLAGLGLGAVVAAMPWLFGVIRWVGVAYLVWLAIHSLRTPLTGRDAPAVRPSRAFRDGLIVNLSNPKVILFVLAFIPQFVDPARGQVLLQFMIFGAALAIGGFVVNGAVGYFAGGIGRAMVRDMRIERVLRYVCASIFMGLAGKLAWDSRT
ncbi:LysE family translocator [Yoonia sp. SDW83-1]|uniref:LysE family translocator n=1 Tax=Yoonia sp. SDW83-1 TaxID=3366945 RepID=UPI00398C8059